MPAPHTQARVAGVIGHPEISTVPAYCALVRQLASGGLLDAVDAALASARSRLAPASLHPLYVASIRAYARAGRLRDAVDAFERMDLFSCPPAAPAYNAIMDALVHAAYHDQAHKVYLRMLAAGISPDLHTHTIRLRSFCLTARPHIALRLLRGLPHPRPVAYCTVVCGLYAHGDTHDARHLFDQMLQAYVFPNLPAFNKVLHALCKKGHVLEAGLLLGKVIKRGMSVNHFTYNIWIRGLCEAGRLAEAVQIVDQMSVPDVVTYNTLVRGLCKESKPQEAAQYLRRMMNHGCLPDDFTYNTIIHGYCKMSMVQEATELLRDAVFKGFVPDQVTYCSLINGLCAEGDVERALELFNEAQAKGIKPGIAVYNSLIKGLCLQGLILHALQVMNEMAEDGCHPDIQTYNIVINGLCKMGNISDATVVMNDAVVKGYLPDVFTFNTLIDGYCKRLKLDSALQLVERMWTYGITPDVITYNSVLNGLCKAGKVNEVNETFEEMILKGCPPNPITYNILIENFCKSNKLEEASKVIVKMSQEGLHPDAVSFNTLIYGFCRNGDLEEAYLLFQKLEEKGYPATADTFNTLIGAFSGKLNMHMAEKIFYEMISKGHTPDSYTYRVLIDGSCKTANVDRAYKHLVEMISKGFIPSMATFGRVINSLTLNHQISQAVGVIHIMVKIGIVPEVVDTILSADKKEIAAPKILVEDLMKKGHISYPTYEVLHEGVYSTIYCLQYRDWRSSDPKCSKMMEGWFEQDYGLMDVVVGISANDPVDLSREPHVGDSSHWQLSPAGCIEINVDGAQLLIMLINPMVPPVILTWGDVYVDKATTDTEIDLYDNPIESKNQIVSYPLCPIEAALLSMSSNSYSLGEELIGKVALTGQHCWISSDELSSTFMHKYHKDLQLEFAAGIKTILYVPVIPHGVLQLGSLDLVSESSTSVPFIKDLFYRLYDASISGSSSGTGSGYSNAWRQPAATLPTNSPDVATHYIFNSIKSSAQLLNNDHLSLPHAFPMLGFSLTEDDIVSIYDTSLTACAVEPLDGNDNDIWTTVHEELSQFTHCNTAFEPDKENISYMDSLINPGSKSCRTASHMEDPGYGDIDHFILTEISHENQEHMNNNNSINHDAVTSNSSFDLELNKTLEPISREERADCMWHIRLRQQELTSSALLQEDGYKTGFCKQHENNNYVEFLLDAIIEQVGRTSNCDSSHSTNSPVSCATQIQKEDHVTRDESLPNLPGGQDFSLISIDEGLTGSSPMEINKTVLVEEFISDSIEGMHRETSVEVKGRCRKTGLHRPRPRDRQLIQDRMKELRQLVPNTSECSIDALLDKTIAHMQFLRSVSEKADKLEKLVSSEESTKRQPGSCPLKVEELDPPGHLLIEMLCGEYGVFLEIAHVLKGLEVNILKGLLENRSDKLWARFVIQASQDSMPTDAPVAEAEMELTELYSSYIYHGSSTLALHAHLCWLKNNVRIPNRTKELGFEDWGASSKNPLVCLEALLTHLKSNVTSNAEIEEVLEATAHGPAWRDRSKWEWTLWRARPDWSRRVSSKRARTSAPSEARATKTET
uniref:BHLH domain-containing protein n=1 Tax=Leersia perrieri TaxID=77586 RepID=A0A0D9WUI0_9ORYZ